MIGEGIVEKKPQSLAKNEMPIMMIAEFRITCLLATLVIAMQLMFSEYDVIPPPVPKIPAIHVARPSIAMPRLIACLSQTENCRLNYFEYKIEQLLHTLAVKAIHTISHTQNSYQSSQSRKRTTFRFAR